MSKTKKSVCIATYNGEKYIVTQLVSILKQLDVDDEIIVSDDLSTDSTVSLINNLNDNRIKIYFNRGRSGPVGNFENALKHADGNYIFLSDQDDIWMPDKVNDTCNLLKQYDLVLSNCCVVNNKELIIYNSFFSHRGSRPGFWRNIYKNSYMGCCMAFRAEILSYVLPFPNSIYMHDWWIGLLVEVKGSVHFYDKPLIKYLRHGNNLSPTGEDGYNVFRKVENRFNLLMNLVLRLLH